MVGSSFRVRFAAILAPALLLAAPALANGAYQCFDSDGAGGDQQVANKPGGVFGGYYSTGGVVWRGFDGIKLPFVITRAWISIAASPGLQVAQWSMNAELHLDPGAAFVKASGYPPNVSVPAGNTTPEHVIRLASAFRNYWHADRADYDHDLADQGIVMEPGDAIYSSMELSVSRDGQGTVAIVRYAICGHNP